MTESFDNAAHSLQQFQMGGDRPADDDGPPVAGVRGLGLEAEVDYAKDPRYVTRRTYARSTDLIVHFRMDWRRVCRGIDGSHWAVCGDIDGSCSVCAGIGSSRFGALCAINPLAVCAWCAAFS